MNYPYAIQAILDCYENLTAEDAARRLRYSSFVSIPKRYMYFEVPKAACTQMKELLCTVEKAAPTKLFTGAVRETRRDMFIHARQSVPLPSLADLDDKTQMEVLESPDFLRMTFVRNPYTRLVSAWKNKVRLCEPGFEDVYLQTKGHLPELHAKSLITFDEFVEYVATRCDLRTCDSHWRRQVDHTFFAALNFSSVGKIEQMAEGLQRFQQHLGLSEPLVAKGRNASGSGVAVAYTRELAEKVYSLYQSDFEVLGYDREAWPGREQDSCETSENATVPEEIFSDEIIERNLIISCLYQERKRLSDERDRLQGEVQKVSRLHLLAFANAVVALRRVTKRLLGAVKTLPRRVLHRLSVNSGREHQEAVDR